MSVAICMCFSVGPKSKPNNNSADLLLAEKQKPKTSRQRCKDLRHPKMPKYFCDYCDTYLTHDSPSVRKTHCSGRKHKENVKFYYQKWMEEQAQNLIDATTAAFKVSERLAPGQFKDILDGQMLYFLWRCNKTVAW